LCLNLTHFIFCNVDGKVYIKAARSNKKDIDLATKAAKTAFTNVWSKTSVTERSNLLLKIADVVEANLNHLALVESIDNGKPIRETMAADLPLVVDHFRYFAGLIRADEGTATEIDSTTVSICISEPYGVVGQIIPWNFPLLMAAWKIAPALAAGNTVVLKPAEQTPTSIMVLMDLIKEILPPGVLNIVTGFGEEAGAALATSTEISKLAFTGETNTGKLIMKNAAENLIPVTMELGGKSPQIFFSSVLDHDDEFLDKAVEGAVLFALNQGEVCTCPSRVLIQEDIYEEFMKRVLVRTQAITQGHPLDPNVMIGAQASSEQMEKIEKYLKIARKEGAEILTGGARDTSIVEGGYYIQPTIVKGTNEMRVFQEEIFGPVLCATTFKTEEEALAIANDTVFGLGAGVWTRDAHQAYQVPRAIQAGRVWVNCYVCDTLPPPLSVSPSPLAASLPCSRSLWWIQKVWFWSRDTQTHSQCLSPDQEHVGELQQEQAGVLLSTNSFLWREEGGCLCHGVWLRVLFAVVIPS
jgi:aldehyde dehydrogenase